MSDARLKAARDILAEAERRSVMHNGPCRACRWSRFNLFMGDMKCRNPMVRAQIMTIDNPSTKPYADDCGEQRAQSSNFVSPTLCGPEGTLFEPGMIERVSRYVRGEEGA